MASLTIANADPTDTGQRDEHGNAIWELDIVGVGTVVLHRRSGNKPPVAGTVVNGKVKDGRLYLDKPAQNGGERRSGGGKKDDKDFDRRPDHPLNMARALHTSCLSSVPAFVEQMAKLGVVEAPQDEQGYWELVGHVAGKLRASYPEPIRKWAEGGS